MTAQDLKNAILQLAVQGKLVPQDPNDEPASELLKRIKAEKERLVKEGKIKREKALDPVADDEIPFDIPESWEWVHLNQIATSSLGKTMDKARNSGTECPYLCSINVYWEGISLSTIKTALFTEEEKRRYSLSYGDLLICEGGEVGRTAVWESNNEMYYQNALHRVRFYDNISPYYFRFLMEYLKGAGIIDQYGKGQTIKHLVQGALNSILMPLPPLAEQQRIVAKIEELMPLVEEYRKAEERLTALNAEFPDKLRKSILQQAIQGKLTERDPADEPASELLKRIRAEKERLIKEGKIKKEKPLPPITEEEIPFEIPENWEWVRLSEICNISDGTHQTPHYVDHGVPFISAQNVKPYRFIPEIHRDVSERDYLEYNKVVAPEKGDILMTRVGAGIGEAAIIDLDFKFSIYVSLTLIKRYGNVLNMEYLLHVLNSPQGRKLAEKKTLGKGASQGNLNLFFIREFVLPVPPLAEQQRIVDRVNELLAVCGELK